jgi:glutamine synthetase
MLIAKDIAIKLIHKFMGEFIAQGLHPKIGAEIEFYLLPNDSNKTIACLQEFDLHKERGEGQFELKTNPSYSIILALEEIVNLRRIISQKAILSGLETCFKAKPFANQPGSALQISLSLHNYKGENLLLKTNKKESAIMLHAIGGLCHDMAENIILCNNSEDDFKRYQAQEPETPCKICWGSNNRSAAIRIPDSKGNDRRIEYRIAAANACPYNVLLVILSGALYGIKNKISPPNKLYGNAFLEQYEFDLLPNYHQAKLKFLGSRLKFLSDTFACS